MEALKLSLAPLTSVNLSGNKVGAPARQALLQVASSVRGKTPSLQIKVDD